MTQIIQFYGTGWCKDCIRAKKWLEEQNIEFQYHDIEKEKGTTEYITKLNNGARVIPTIIFPDESVLFEPTNEQLAKKLKKSSKKVNKR